MDVAVVIATFLGPVFAVQAQKWIEIRRERKGRRLWIFRALMTTRATPLSPTHVEALNSVPIEFYGRGKIIDQWKIYLEHLGKDVDAPGWGDRRVDLLADMLQSMAELLGYDFKKVEITQEAYMPKGHFAQMSDQDLIRAGLAQLFAGKAALPLDIKSVPIDKEALDKQKELRQHLLNWLRGRSTPGIELKK